MLGTGVRLFEMAIGRSQSHGIINVSRRADSSTLPLIAKQSEIFPGTELWEKRVVLVARLTKFLPLGDLEPLALFKIDVQGYKLEVLKGCHPLIFAFRHVYSDCSFVELCPGQALDGNVVLYLLRRNFELCGVYNQWRRDSNGRPVLADFLFARSGSLLPVLQALRRPVGHSTGNNR
jgi:FkbM family methyltransferase